jgi:choline dehydrogenase
MGTDPNAGAVVDWTASVFGVSGLRVVDASVIPFALPGHPQATIYALAEKIAQSILNGD